MINEPRLLKIYLDDEKRKKIERDRQYTLPSQNEGPIMIQFTMPIIIDLSDAVRGEFTFKGPDINFTEYGVLGVEIN